VIGNDIEMLKGIKAGSESHSFCNADHNEKVKNRLS
jgi:hypothetical protein